MNLMLKYTAILTGFLIPLAFFSLVIKEIFLPAYSSETKSINKTFYINEFKEAELELLIIAAAFLCIPVTFYNLIKYMEKELHATWSNKQLHQFTRELEIQEIKKAVLNTKHENEK